MVVINKRLMKYIGTLGGGSKLCIRFTFEGYMIDSEKLQKESTNGFITNSDYYVLIMYSGFVDEQISPKHKDVRIAARSASLKVTLFEGYPKSCLPKLEEDQQEIPVEYEYCTRTTRNGRLNFIPLKLGTKVQSSLKLLSKVKLSKSNTYCYSIRNDVSAEWRFERRQGESFLKAQKETILVIEVPKVVFPRGKVELSVSQLSFFKNGREIVGFWDRLLLKLKKVGLDTSWYSPVSVEFETTPPVPWSAQTRRFTRTRGFLPTSTLPPSVLKIVEDELAKI